MQKPFENLNKDRGSVISAIFEDLKVFLEDKVTKYYVEAIKYT